MMTFLAVFLAAIACCAAAKYHQNEVACYDWVRIGQNVCFRGMRDSPGQFVPEHQGFVSAFKLVYKSGSIRCGIQAGKKRNSGTVHDSHFGCANWNWLLHHSLNMFITNERKEVVAPLHGVRWLSGPNPGRWYHVDGFDSQKSFLVLQTGFGVPYYLSPWSHLSVWYGEDLVNKWEADNIGRVCVDVYARFM